MKHVSRISALLMIFVGTFLFAGRLNSYSEFELCTTPSSVYTGGCCSGAGQLPTLNWTLTTTDTLCDGNNSPMTTDLWQGVPFHSVPTVSSEPAEDFCGCVSCTQEHSYQVSYWLQIDDDIAFGSPELDTPEIVSSIRSYTVPLGQIPNGTYYWRVRIKDQYGLVTPWVAEATPFQFPLDCSAPTPGAPVTPVQALPPYNNGSNTTVCATANDQPPVGGCYDGNFPVVKVDWSFTSVQSDFSNSDGLPLTAEGYPMLDNPFIAPVTQLGYWLEVDNDINFGSVDYRTGYVASSDEFHSICFDVLDFSTTYYWRVAVLDSSNSIGDDGTGVWAFDNTRAFTTVGKCAPDQPRDMATIITPQPSSCSFIEIQWTDNSYNEDGFLVERSYDGTTNWSTACNVGQNVNSCYVAMPPQTTWYFRVQAYTFTGGSSAWEPAPGTGTAGTDGIAGTSFDYCAPVVDIPVFNCDCANLTWTVLGDESQIDHYKVERSINGGVFNVLAASLPTGTLNYDDCDITSGIKLYEYIVTAYDDAAELYPAESAIFELAFPCQKLPLWKESK